MKRSIFLLLLSLVLILAACGADQKPEASEVTTESAVTYQPISAQEVRQMLNSGEAFTLVDVRTLEEYAEGHIPTAILIPNESIFDVRPETLPDVNAPIVLYCRSGRRSKEAAEKLTALGYTDIRDLGGIIDWPYDTVTGSKPGKWTVSTGVLSSFSTTDLDGSAVTHAALADYRLTMVNVWATYCGPCLREMPELGELAAEYKEKNVQILGFVTDVLNSDGTLSDSQLQTARDVVASTKADYPHMVPSRDLFGILSQITSVPTTFFVDSEGNQVGQVYIGSRNKDQWAAILDATLAEVAK